MGNVTMSPDSGRQLSERCELARVKLSGLYCSLVGTLSLMDSSTVKVAAYFLSAIQFIETVSLALF